MRDRNHVHPGGRVLAAVLSGLLATSAMAPYAFAQPKPTAAEAGKNMTKQQKRDAARKHYSTGKDKLDAKDYAGALVEFQAANALIPSPQAQEKIALCYDGMGNVPKAIEAYETFIEQAEGKPKLADNVKRAKERVEALKQAPVPVKVVSDPPSAQVEVDGEAQMGATPLELKLTPGTHRIKVSAAGFESIEKEVEVKPGEEMKDLSFSLPQSADAVAATPPPVAAPPPTEAPPGADQGVQERSNLPAYITLGVAGASAVVGTVFGVKALKEKSDFNDFPTTDRADDTERFALISDMAFGVAVTLGVTGTVLLLSNDAETQEQAAKEEPKKTMQLTPYVGPSGGGAAATWRF
ncbi:MAG: PEGA domain-containing protein [Myxococcota bacterium]